MAGPQGTLECTVTRVGFGNPIAFLAERLRQEAPQIAIVFDDENLHSGNLKPPALRGNREEGS